MDLYEIGDRINLPRPAQKSVQPFDFGNATNDEVNKTQHIFRDEKRWKKPENCAQHLIIQLTVPLTHTLYNIELYFIVLLKTPNSILNLINKNA